MTEVGPEPTRSRAGPAEREEVTQAGRWQEGADLATSQGTKEGPPGTAGLHTSGLQRVNLSRFKPHPRQPRLACGPFPSQSASHRPARPCLQASPSVRRHRTALPGASAEGSAGRPAGPTLPFVPWIGCVRVSQSLHKDTVYCSDFAVSSSFLFKERIGLENTTVCLRKPRGTLAC